MNINGVDLPVKEEDWDVAIVDAKPKVVISLDGIRDLVMSSPLGVEEALRRMRSVLSDTHLRELQQLVNGAV